jgi:hypothetical protein
VIPLDSEWPETRQDFIYSFPRFLFMNLGRDVCKIRRFEKGCRSYSVPLILDMTSDAFDRGVGCEYQFWAGIAPVGIPDHDEGH